MAALFALALSVCFWGCSTQGEKQARDFAESVLRMKDRGKFRDLYRGEFNAKMRQAMTEDQWAATAERVDRVIGPLISRKFDSSGYSILAGAYRFRYKAQYQNFNGFDEVVVSREGDKFKVAGLWLKRGP